ncbi:MAG: Histidyl-tRNA synthetase [Candidatus Pacebacteria bacterium GW2011_GWF2_38_9]|nr:MAG: histidyl-tRNA synthetase, histidyl-tRNA synthetase [candidate division TM6 bacterium GW2011_GWF2_28_16]KKQ08852.1 MAG: Histidyl-tRNA synthetase [Candidatus Pacebacteria bacterium GW2011_GWF1_36_5]KKQ89117.1 MAG: Histidyl-tRNA synthetase [Candidatus Pacebacteria bacterium GW2011_GWF2_38_9]HAZ73617.1 histidine--tRNA ligase [Candidatus Paceibacterota bacterium]
MNKNVQTLKGFRDFLPDEARKRQYVNDKIRETFEVYGFAPLQSPTLEYASLLLGKYGDEADKLVYTFEDRGGREVGLRYDQTVPTARILSQYQNELPKYFRRYQIQNVFRADKPQKGRYREFTQCDCDIFGGNSVLADAELLATVNAVFMNLGLKSIKIEFNDRTLLIENISPFVTEKVDVFSIIQSIDKLDKESSETIIEELVDKGLSRSNAEAVLSKINKIEISGNLSRIEQKALELGVSKETLVFNPKLARGLDYYTGLIFEIKIPEYGNSSVGGGGRYDNLIEELSGYKMPAVGVGLGFDRIVEVCDQLGLIKENQTGTQVMIGFFEEENCQNKAMQIAKELRALKIRTEVFPAYDKLSKQFKVAEQKKIPFVIVVGEDEIKENKFTIKNMASGEQELLALEEIKGKFKVFSPSLL